MSIGHSTVHPRPKLLFVVNVTWFFISHRIALATAARVAGFDVHLAADGCDPSELQILARAGIQFHRIRVRRRGLNPFVDVAYLAHLIALMRRLRPDVIHNVTSKPVIYGTLAARLLGIPGIVNSVSGLGYAFSGAGSRRSLSVLLTKAYRFSFGKSDLRVIFQNPDDMNLFVKSGIVKPDRVVLIRGSGVDVETHVPMPESSDEITILFPARMLRDKGVVEFAQAARLVRLRGLAAKFVLAGKLDPGNPAALGQHELLKLAEETGVLWLGHVEDMPELYRRAHIVCLPSYREGLSKSLIEACAFGKAIITTNVPGCRDVVSHGVNGILVEPRAIGELADAMIHLISNAPERHRMASESRRRAEVEFDLRLIVRQTLDLYKTFLMPRGNRT